MVKEKEQKVFLTIFTKKDISKEDQKDPNKIVINQLAKVIYNLENRIIQLEKMLLGRTSDKRMIKVIQE